MKGTVANAVAVCWCATVLCGSASAQTPGSVAATDAARDLLRFWTFETVAADGPADVDGETFVSAATAVRGWSLSTTSQSTPNRYGFPLRVRGNLQQLGGNPVSPTAWTSWLRRSEVSASYSPFTVQEVQVSRPQGADTKLDVDKSRAATFGYKIELVAPDIDDYSAALAKLAADAFTTYIAANPSTGGLIPDTQLAALQSAIDAAVEPALKKYKAQVKSDLKVAAATTYLLNWQQGSRDEATMRLTASKGGFGQDSHPIGFALEGAWTLVRRESAVGQSYIARTAGSIDVGLLENVKATSEVSFNHNYGSGFTGIRGVLDAGARREVNLSQQIGLSVAGNFVNFAVRVLHLGTGDPDLTLLTEFGFKFLSEATKRALKRAETK